MADNLVLVGFFQGRQEMYPGPLMWPGKGPTGNGPGKGAQRVYCFPGPFCGPSGDVSIDADPVVIFRDESIIEVGSWLTYLLAKV